MIVTVRPALSAPLLDVMTFLNEITHAYPSAVSFAPGRPAEQFFDVKAALEGIRATRPTSRPTIPRR